MNTKKRTLATLAGVAVVGGFISVAPGTTTTAEAGQAKVKVKSKAAKQQTQERVVRVARSKVGKQYRMGGTGPSSFDCSGLMYYSYRKATGKKLPRTSYAQRRGTKAVARRNLQRGDLLFFRGNGHVGMYIGKNKFVHASNPRTDVRIDSLTGYWGRSYNGAARVIFSK